MAVNTIEYSTIMQNQLDLAAIQESCTGWMDANAGQVKYSGGDEVKIPTLAMEGLADYQRAGNKGFVDGALEYKYNTYKMTQDRGRSFGIDKNDVDESGFVLTASTIMGEFQREHVIPEIDAYRISKLAATAISATTMVEDAYTPESDTIIKKMKLGVKEIRKQGFNGALVIMLSYDAQMEYELAMANKISAQSFTAGGFNTQCPFMDGIPLLAVPDNRMYTTIQLYDGVTDGQTAGGYIKGTDSKDINFIICPKSTPIAVSKQDDLRIFDPTVNQKFSGWSMDYRRYHELWVKKNQEKSIYLNTK
ncbi:hypothetical protein LF65_02277 [Clostridium beijerinckii]|uniref:Capsid protein n=1 Tax=Clostridium beijerinckii TaxID=1520 RepID=A0A0B5QPQ9_CLOBE|nr:hypothetical protein [Clostridium beijerinckii]AJG98863.1 hypothetical protein LF65_02277 [Clostridium beijerinckii]